MCSPGLFVKHMYVFIQTSWVQTLKHRLWHILKTHQHRI